MATILIHRKVNIVVLELGEAVADHSQPGDIVIVPDATGWWTKFIAADGKVDSYDIPYPSYNKALWAAKAAAEYGIH